LAVDDQDLQGDDKDDNAPSDRQGESLQPDVEGAFELHFGGEFFAEMTLDELMSLPAYLVPQGATCPECSITVREDGTGELSKSVSELQEGGKGSGKTAQREL
jgi:hypothetical protein